MNFQTLVWTKVQRNSLYTSSGICLEILWNVDGCLLSWLITGVFLMGPLLPFKSFGGPPKDHMFFKK